MNASAQGDQALSNSDCLSAIRHYTQALVELPRAPIYYIKRSTAHSRVKPADGGPKSVAALHDAEVALVLARERGRRELILAAQMRRGVALYQLERFGDARLVFETIKEKARGGGGDGTQTKDRSEEVRDAMASKSAKNGYEQELPIWMAKVQGRLNKLEEGDIRAKVSVGEYPDAVQVPTEKELKEQLGQLKAGKMVTGGGLSKSVPGGEKKPQVVDDTKTQDRQGGVAASGAAPGAPAPVNVRHEWYQSNDSVVVTLYVKGIAKDKVDSDLKDDSMNIQFPLPTGTDYAFSLDPLFALIDPSANKVSVMSTKIEITLRKQIPGQKWNALESTATSTTKLMDRAATTAPNPKPTAADAAGPSYPTSSRHGTKNWDKVASELTTKQKSKSEKKDDAGNHIKEADSDEEGADGVDSFFKKLYAGADPDTRRAMMKSYVESQGTSLSTNWGEVSQGKVEPKP